VVFIFIFGYTGRIGRESDREQMRSCAANLRALGLTIFLYAEENEGMYPAGGKWCDLLSKYANITESEFRCPNADAKGGRSSYALNKNVAGRKVADVPRSVVLLFEAGQGWNQCGGLELVTTENHGGQGCNVLFNDGHVELVRLEHISILKWK
jgi:prepilin-type processing-associated H-X9-DG protein